MRVEDIRIGGRYRNLDDATISKVTTVEKVVFEDESTGQSYDCTVSMFVADHEPIEDNAQGPYRTASSPVPVDEKPLRKFYVAVTYTDDEGTEYSRNGMVEASDRFEAPFVAVKQWNIDEGFDYVVEGVCGEDDFK